MGSEGGEAASRRTLREDFWSGLEVTPGAAAGVRSRITMDGDGEASGSNPVVIAARETVTRSSPLLSRACESKRGTARVEMTGKEMVGSLARWGKF
jgi:hypothetical protein